MIQYNNLVKDILSKGTAKGDRTGTGVISLFGYQMRFYLNEGFPLITTKKVNFDAIVHELLWFLKGDTNIKYLKDNNVNIWNEWADENGDLGRVYGKQWRSWTGCNGVEIDQISSVINEIKTNPNSRRLIVSAWNVSDLEDMALPPCHCLFQFYVNNGRLSCQLYQRSADVFLGLPFNIASYSLLTMMIASVTGLGVGEFIHTIGDAHIYNNHIHNLSIQLGREEYELPTVKLNTNISSVFDFKRSDIVLENYNCHSFLRGDVAV